jgi:hypothetical protein
MLALKVSASTLFLTGSNTIITYSISGKNSVAYNWLANRTITLNVLADPNPVNTATITNGVPILLLIALMSIN